MRTRNGETRSSLISRTIRLGDREIARIGLGTNRLRNTGRDIAFIRDAVGAGVQMIDTARLYTSGESEQAIGRAVARSKTVVVATKGGYGDRGRGKPDVLRRDFEQSITSLGVDKVTLYYLHRVDPETPIEQSLGAIKELVDARRIQHVGISAVDVPLIERARKVLPIAAAQNEYNLSNRKYDDVIDYCTREEIVFVPYFPLQGKPGRSARDTARKRGVSLTQVIFAWQLRRSPMMLPIPGTLSLAHLKDNLGALTLDLSDQEFEAIAADV